MIKKFNLINNKDFLFLWLGHSISIFGDSVYSIAVMWYVMLVTGSTVQMGISLIFSQVPIVLLSPIAGVIADRFNRKKILIICDIISGILIGVVFILSLSGLLKIWIIYAISFLIASIGAFFSPSINAVIPSIVKKEDLPVANSMNQLTRFSCGIVGPALAGILIAVTGVKILFIINSVSFIISSIFEIFINVPPVSKDKEKTNNNLIKSFIEDLKEGFIYCVNTKVIFFFMIVAGIIVNFLTAPLDIYIPIYSSKILKSNSSAYGLLIAIIAVGGIASSLISPIITKKIKHYYLLTIGVAGEGIFMISFALSKNLITAAISLLLLGCSFGITNSSLSIIMQTLIPNEIMGRVSSVFGMIAGATVPLGYFIGGIISKMYVVTSIVLASGIIVTIAGISTIKITNKEVNKGII